MAFTYSIDSVEYGGGGVGIYGINTASYTAPTSYSSYVQIAPTDGVEFNFETDEELIYADQTSGAIDSFLKVTRCFVDISVMSSTAKLIGVAMNLKTGFTTGVSADSNDYNTGLTDDTMYGEGTMTTNRAYFGAIRAKTYYDLQYEKPMSHATTKVIGYRLTLVSPEGNFSWAGKHEEKDFWNLKFNAFINTLATGEPYNNEFGYWLYQTA